MTCGYNAICPPPPPPPHSLPMTGLDLLLWALVGIVIVAGGIYLRRASR